MVESWNRRELGFSPGVAWRGEAGKWPAAPARSRSSFRLPIQPPIAAGRDHTRGEREDRGARRSLDSRTSRMPPKITGEWSPDLDPLADLMRRRPFDEDRLAGLTGIRTPIGRSGPDSVPVPLIRTRVWHVGRHATTTHPSGAEPRLRRCDLSLRISYGFLRDVPLWEVTQ
jgi:hypothetical protein